MSGDTTLAKPSSKSADGSTAGTGAGKSVKRKKKAARKPSAKTAAKIIEQRIGHTFENASLLATAFTHVSALKSARNRADSYQRLEFLGDHVLGLIVSDMLFSAFPKADEGELSKRLADLVRKEACADVARSLGLDEAIKLGSVGAGAGARLRKSVLGDICEAVIGAIFLEGASSMFYFTGTRWGSSERTFGVVLPARGEPAWIVPGFEEARACWRKDHPLL